MLTGKRTAEISRKLIKAVDDALAERGVSARSVSLEVVGHDGLIRDIRAGRIPSFDRVVALIDYLGLDLSFVYQANSDLLAFDPDHTFPHQGLARCSIFGWSDDQQARDPLPRPAWVTDERAFWVSAAGQSMYPEGIQAGDCCIVSPARAPKVGDRVFVKEAGTGKAAIKRLTAMDERLVTLRGWLPPADGTQQEYVEERPADAITALHPVIGVYRGLPGEVDGEVRFIPDPRGRLTGDQDGLVVIDAEGATPRSREPFSLGFPEPWLRSMGIGDGCAGLAIVADSGAEPTVAKGATVLLNTGSKSVRSARQYAIRRDGSVIVRRLEIVGDGALLILGSGPSPETTLVPVTQKAGVDILGEVVWVGQRF